VLFTRYFSRCQSFFCYRWVNIWWHQRQKCQAAVILNIKFSINSGQYFKDGFCVREFVIRQVGQKPKMKFGTVCCCGFDSLWRTAAVSNFQSASSPVFSSDKLHLCAVTGEWCQLLDCAWFCQVGYCPLASHPTLHRPIHTISLKLQRCHFVGRKQVWYKYVRVGLHGSDEVCWDHDAF
jgi:hypothetical protein